MGEHGQGTISSRADGRLAVAVTMLDGRRVWRYVPKDRDPGRQMRRAEKLRKELVALRDRDLEPSMQTIEDFLRSQLASLRDARHARIRPRTLEHYEYVAERHIIPALGRIRLDQLRPHHIQRWLDSAEGSLRTVHHQRAVLRMFLNIAASQRLIDWNPIAGVRLPDAPDFEGKPLTAAEARALIAATAGDWYGPLWRLAIVTGMRESELLGLAWDDLDLDAGTVAVQHQLARVLENGVRVWRRVPTKAARDLASIALDAETTAALRAHQRRMAEARDASWRFYGLVFVTPKGTPVSRSDALRSFKAACRAAGIAERRFHDLRGTAATLLADAGVAEDVRMRRLGHATTDMARHYAKGSETQDRVAVEKLAEALA